MDTETQAPSILLADGSERPQMAVAPRRVRIVEQSDADNLPAYMPRDWRIEMRYMPVLHRAHAYLALVDPSGKIQRELHRLAQSRNSNDKDNIVALGVDGAKLIGAETKGPAFYDPEAKKIDPSADPTKFISTVFEGPYEDAVGKWHTGLQAAATMNTKDLDYKADDLSFELGTNGGEIQNSNSANFSFGKPMHLDLGTAIRNQGIERMFPGFGRDVLDPTYKPYVAPEFPPKNNL
jgi:hypothetical protein